MAERKTILNLDENVLEGLNFFLGQKLPTININKKDKMVIVGSGNALAVGRILFRDYDVEYADEGNYLRKLDKVGKGVCYVISASGGKHSPAICRIAKSRGFRVILLTNNQQGLAMKYADESLVFGKIEEPYTYNFSTYMGMILSQTKEKPQKILENVKELEKNIPKNLGKYKSFYFILPSKFDFIKEMFRTKFDELFGPKLGVRLYTLQQTKHAKTIVSDDKELFISMGDKNNIFGKNRWNVDLDDKIECGEFIALMYFIIGKIQKANKPYFKENIAQYVKQSSKIFNQRIETVVK
ncbi:MAG TPA: hypothetical protein VHA12_02995 [Candidatus Nanoarchaeia archaeon]|nr:hypothetical protein [Candidatus Nanoarchaeia archaeon]